MRRFRGYRKAPEELRDRSHGATCASSSRSAAMNRAYDRLFGRSELASPFAGLVSGI